MQSLPIPALPTPTRISLNNILLATDFSNLSTAALPFAIALANWYGAKVFVAHVVPPEPYLGVAMEPAPIQTDLLWNSAQREMDALLSREEFAHVPHNEILRRGEIWTTISGILHRNAIDLIVIGTHGRQGLKKMFMGSVAEKIFRQADCPVLTVGPEVATTDAASWEPARILFPTDFTATSLHALPYALSLAEEKQGTLILMHSIPLTPYQYQDAVRENISKKLERLVTTDVWCKFEFVVEFEFVADTILRAACEHKADLVVMGVNKRATATISSHLPWSTASQVVGRAPCPVLTVRG
jgi:nucleotide-binding universal stress UspA family protein